MMDSQSVRADCISFLSSIYESVAEVIPDVRDTDAPVDGEGANASKVILDAYEIQLQKSMDTGPADLPSRAHPVPKKKKFT